MYVYISSDSNLWTVGFYRPDGTWEAESDHPNPEKAAARVNYLNGGRHLSERKMRKMSIILLDDVHGINDNAYNLLWDDLDEDIINKVKGVDGRWFLPSNHGLK